MLRGFPSTLDSRPSLLKVLWRASPHCMVVNLVRSGRKQPKLFSASAGVRLATPIEAVACRAMRHRVPPVAAFEANT